MHDSVGGRLLLWRLQVAAKGDRARYGSQGLILLADVHEERRPSMLAYRWTFLIKQGQMEEALELNKSTPFNPDYVKSRIYTPDLSPNVFVFELDVEDQETVDRFFDEFNATPEAEPFWEKWNALVERHVSTERWNLTEFR
jgi:hypothetical protein